MKKINERIEKIISLTALSNSEFADRIEVPRSSISHLLSGRNKPSLDFLMKIKAEFPKYRWDWLIYGSGEMEETEIKESEPEKIPKQSAASLPDLFSMIGDEQFGTTESEDKILKTNPASFPETVQEDLQMAAGDSQRLENSGENRALKAKETEKNTVKKIVFFYENGTFEIFEP